MTIVNIQIYLTVQLLFIGASFFPIPGSNQGPWFTFGSCVSNILQVLSLFFDYFLFKKTLGLVSYRISHNWNWSDCFFMIRVRLNIFTIILGQVVSIIIGKVVSYHSTALSGAWYQLVPFLVASIFII